MSGRLCDGSRVFCDHVLKRVILHRQVGIHPLKLVVLGFQVAKAMYISRFHAAVFRLPHVIRGVGNPQLSAHILDLPAGLHLLQGGNDLAFGELALANRWSPWGYFARRPLLMSGSSLRGVDTLAYGPICIKIAGQRSIGMCRTDGPKARGPFVKRRATESGKTAETPLATSESQTQARQTCVSPVLA